MPLRGYNMQFASHRKRRARLDINLVPLINVIFLLLIFFMVGGNVGGDTVTEVTLPVAESSDSVQAEPMDVMLTKDDIIVVNGNPVPDDMLARELKEQFSHYKNGLQPVIVKADARQSAKKMLFLVRMLGEAGFTNISLVTKKI